MSDVITCPYCNGAGRIPHPPTRAVAGGSTVRLRQLTLRQRVRSAMRDDATRPRLPSSDNIAASHHRRTGVTVRARRR
jgi:hypothetical protein